MACSSDFSRLLTTEVVTTELISLALQNYSWLSGLPNLPGVNSKLQFHDSGSGANVGSYEGGRDAILASAFAGKLGVVGDEQ